MKLIDIGQPNILINPDNIDYIEQRNMGVTSITYICIGGKEFMVTIKLEDLWQRLGIGEMSSGSQHFAG